MKKTIFIDGEYGTTGLKIKDQLEKADFYDDIRLLSLPEADKKNASKREKLYKEADLIVLCLPDTAAKQAYTQISKVNAHHHARVLDASSAHRVASNWVYGFSEIRGMAEKIRIAPQVSNPGCYAIGFIAMLRPFIEGKYLNEGICIQAFGVSGYSGGGKSLINLYQGKDNQENHIKKPLSYAPYALDLQHKHIPEMQKYSLLEKAPLFQAAVEPIYAGMLVNIAFHRDVLGQNRLNPDAMLGILQEYYASADDIHVKGLENEVLLNGQFLDFSKNTGSSTLDIIVAQGNDHAAIWSRLDNLGKGASGNALKNIKMMLNLI